MNWLDLTILCLAGLGFVKGLFDGCIKQVISLIGLYIAACASPTVANYIKEYIVQLNWFSDFWVHGVSLVLGFMFVFGIFIIIGKIISKIIGATPLGILNHLMGGMIGALFVLLGVSILLNVFGFIDPKSVILSKEIQIESQLFSPIKELLPTIMPYDLLDYWK